MIEIRPIGGFGEVGKNCTAVKVDNDVFILDLGLKMDKYVEMTDDEDYVRVSGKQLMKFGAAPDLALLGDWKDKVRAIILSHAHLDHIGAVPYLAERFKCPVYGTPFTIAVLRSIADDQELELKNELIAKEVDSTFTIANTPIEFVNMTHSTPQTVSIVIHTKYGKVMYCLDFKLDFNPLVGKPVNMKQLEAIHPDYLIFDSLYATVKTKTPSESVARELLLDLFTSSDFYGKSIFVSTFSSHIARLKTLVECAHKMKRRVVFLGRSLHKYTHAAQDVGIGDVFVDLQTVKYGSKLKSFMHGLKKPEDYFFIATGHQGEPKAVLSKLLTMFPWKKEDVVVFSCKIIPSEPTIKHRAILEQELKKRKVRIYTDVHVSGHGAREDIRDLIKALKPKKILPAHSPIETMKEVKSFVQELGYAAKDIVLLNNGETLKL